MTVKSTLFFHFPSWFQWLCQNKTYSSIKSACRRTELVICHEFSEMSWMSTQQSWMLRPRQKIQCSSSKFRSWLLFTCQITWCNLALILRTFFHYGINSCSSLIWQFVWLKYSWCLLSQIAIQDFPPVKQKFKKYFIFLLVFRQKNILQKLGI